MILKIDHNHLRTLAPLFMYYQLSKNGKYTEGSVYKCFSDKYGHLGEVKCIISYELHLHEMKPAVLFLSDGRPDGVAKLRADGVPQLERINICLFSFVRRTQKGFSAMIEKELPNIGITLTTQSQLF